MIFFAHETSALAPTVTTPHTLPTTNWYSTPLFAVLVISLVIGLVVWLGLSIIQQRYIILEEEEA